ncbi:MAG: hypothetical protein ACE5JX_21155 [Acidobacteriota bacterium]
MSYRSTRRAFLGGVAGGSSLLAASPKRWGSATGVAAGEDYWRLIRLQFPFRQMTTAWHRYDCNDQEANNTPFRSLQK